MSIDRRPALDAGGCRFESYYPDQIQYSFSVNGNTLDSKSKDESSNLSGYAKIKLTASDEIGRRKRLKIS